MVNSDELLAEVLDKELQVLTNNLEPTELAPIIINDHNLREIYVKVRSWFPELLFFHLTSLQYSSATNNLLLNSILAVYSMYYESRDEPFIFKSQTVNHNYFYKTAVNLVFNEINLLENPSLEVMECLILLSLIDGEKQCFYKRSIHSSIAKNMIQLFESDIKRLKDAKTIQGINSEQCTRIFWSLFMMDNTISSNKENVVKLNGLNVGLTPLPSCEENYLFMNDVDIQSNSYKCLKDFHNLILPTNEDNSGILLIRLYEIWSEIMAFLIEGGRRTHLAPPWDPTSFFAITQEKLSKFYLKLPRNWKWSSERLKVHLIKGTSTSFILINCIYKLCYLVISREYVPFFPYSVEGPVGPVEEPFLNEPPDVEFWSQHSIFYFESTKDLIAIIKSSVDADCEIMSPMFIFCIYTAATTAFYGYFFPWMDPYYKQSGHGIDFNTSGNEMTQLLKSKSRLSSITKSWLSTLLLIKDLYDAISNNRSRAKTLKLGRHSLLDLEHSIQATKATGNRHEFDRSIIDSLNSCSSDGLLSLDLFSGQQDFLMSSIDFDQREFISQILRELNESPV